MNTAQSKRNWFITGCDKGMGLAIAKAALENGDTVAVTLLEKGKKSELAATYGDRVNSYHLDITDSAAIKETVAQIVQDMGNIDVLVNNAGYGIVGSAEETSEKDYRDVFDVNVFGMMEVTRHVLPQMRAQKSGHIINIASLAGFVGLPGMTAYCASKFAVEGYSEALAKEVAPLNVKVTIIEPGGFRTDFAGGSLKQTPSRIPEYRETSEAYSNRVKARHGVQPGDPARLGLALVHIVQQAEPPGRLPLGEDALANVTEKTASLMAGFERWTELSLSTSFVEEPQA